MTIYDKVQSSRSKMFKLFSISVNKINKKGKFINISKFGVYILKNKFMKIKNLKENI